MIQVALLTALLPSGFLSFFFPFSNYNTSTAFLPEKYKKFISFPFTFYSVDLHRIFFFSPVRFFFS